MREAGEEERGARPARRPPVPSARRGRSQLRRVEDSTAKKVAAAVENMAQGGTAAHNAPGKEHARPH